MKNKFSGLLLHLIKTEKSLALVFPRTLHYTELKMKMMYLHITEPEKEGS